MPQPGLVFQRHEHGLYHSNVAIHPSQKKQANAHSRDRSTHLPASIRPSPAPASDLCFFLQAPYLTAKERIFRPVVYMALHCPEFLDNCAPNGSTDLLSLAEQSVSHCASLIRHYFTHYRHDGLWHAIRGSFGAALTIIRRGKVLGRFGRACRQLTTVSWLAFRSRPCKGGTMRRATYDRCGFSWKAYLTMSIG